MKKYVVESWFRTEDTFDTLEQAQAAVSLKNDPLRYKDTRLIELKEN